MKTQITTIDTNVRRFAAQFGYSLLAIALMAFAPAHHGARQPYAD